MHATPAGTQEATVGILRSLFPPWLPGAFAVMFSRPMPGLSCQVGPAPFVRHGFCCQQKTEPCGHDFACMSKPAWRVCAVLLGGAFSIL